MARFDPRIPVMIAANIVLFHLVLMVNSALSGFPLYLLILGPMIVFPALYPRFPSMVICLFFTGLWVDAALPSFFGMCAVGMPFCGAIIYQLRIRFRAEHNFHPVLIGHAVNFVFLAIVTLSAGQSLYDDLRFWKNVIFTSVLSHLAMLLVAPWFFNLQRYLFELFRLDVEPEEYPIL